MKLRNACLLSLALVPAAYAAAADAPKAPESAKSAAPTDDPAPPATYDVFIDGVTGYAFIKTPAGWKFVKNLKAEPKAEEVKLSAR